MFKVISSALITVFMLLPLASAQSESPVGDWHGTLSSPAGSLRLIFKVAQVSGEYSASIVSVDQGGAVIPMMINVDGGAVQFTNTQYDINYQAELEGNEMTGTFRQFGNEFPDFTLVREE